MQGRINESRDSRSIRTVVLLTFAFAALLTAAPAANAATATITGAGAEAKVVYTGEALETNTVTVTYSAQGYRIDDGLAVTITASGGCTLVAGDAVCQNPQPASIDEDAEIELNLGAGDDTASVTVESATTDATINGGAGDDELTGVNGRYLLNGDTGADVLIGGPNADDLWGTSNGVIQNDPNPTDNVPVAGDFLSAGGGFDQFHGGSGDDTFDMGPEPDGGDLLSSGGPGSDTISYERRTQPVAFNMDQEVVVNFGKGGDIATDEVDGTPSPDIENMTGGSADDLLIGGDFNNLIKGGPGSDTICGGLGTDTVDYSDQIDPLNLTLGANNALPANVRILRTGGITAGAGGVIQVNTYGPHGFSTGDTVAISRVTAATNANGTYTITVVDADSFTINGSTFGVAGGQGMAAKAGAVRSVECAQGVDQGGEEGAQDCVADDGLAGEQDCVGENIEHVIGGSGNDTLVGTDPVVYRTPNDPFVLNKKAQVTGFNVMTGGPGDDVLRGGLGTDIFEGGSGSDTVSYEDAGATRDQPRANRVEASINGVKDDGNAVDDTQIITFDEGTPLRLTFDSIGSDMEGVIGGSGNDVLVGSEDENVLEGRTGDDELDGQGGADILGGGEGSDVIQGRDGNDQLRGDDGDDILDGYLGDDQLLGGAGSDTADYSSSPELGVQVDLSLTSAQPTGSAGSDALSADIENLVGSNFDDDLAGDADPNTLSGLSGVDKINSRDGVADTVTCGEGIDDPVVADILDAFPASDCEEVDDGVPPETTITDGPSDLSGSNNATFVFASSEPSSTFECELDGIVTDCSGPFTGLADGSHVFAVRAVDRFGNTDQTAGEWPWVIDTGAPDLNFDSGPSGTVSTNSTAFAFSSPDPEIDHFECSLDGSDWVRCDSPASYSSLAEGQHTFAVRAIDTAGNVGTLTWPFIVALPKPPAGSGLVTPPSGSGLVTPSANSLVLISGSSVKVTKRGFADVKLNCSGPGKCAGSVVLATSKPVQVSRKRIVRLGRAKFTIAASKAKTVRIRISRKNLRLLRRLRKVSANVSVKDRDPAGRARTRSRTIVLKAPRR